MINDIIDDMLKESSFFGALTTALVALKATGAITWTMWQIFSPVLLHIVVLGTLMVSVFAYEKIMEWRRWR